MCFLMESTRRSEGCSKLHWVPGPGCCGPSSSHASPVWATLASSLGQGRSGPLVSILHSWRSPVRTRCASTVSNGGDYRPKGSLLTQLSCVALYKRWRRWSKTVLRIKKTSLKSMNQSFFFFQIFWNFSLSLRTSEHEVEIFQNLFYFHFCFIFF